MFGRATIRLGIGPHSSLFLFGRCHDRLSAVVLKRSVVEMKISIHRNNLRFVLYIKLTCTWFKICILICCACVIVRF